MAIQVITSPTLRKFYYYLPAMLVLFVTILLSWVFFTRSEIYMEKQVKNHIQELAVLASVEFNADELQSIDGREDRSKASFLAIVNKLKAIRASSAYIQNAYILRKSSDRYVLEFVADADSLDPERSIDRKRGHVALRSYPPLPSDPFDVTETPLLQHDAFRRPLVSEKPTPDDSDTALLISSYAPIRDESGKAVAIFGIDMDAAKFLDVSRSIFSPFAFLLVLITGVFCAIFIEIFVSRRRVEIVQQLDEVKTRFLSAASHQLKTPVTGIRWSLDVLASEQAGNITEKQLHIIRNAEACTRQMAETIETMLYISSLESGSAQLQKTDVSILELFTTVQKEKQWEFQQKNQTVNIECPPDFIVKSDRRILHEIISQLVTNAIHYTPDNGTITLRAKNGSSLATIEVQDTGYGIPKQDQPHIFRRFFRAQNAANAYQGGSGLGLYLVQTFTKLLGGTITFASEENHGTTFKVMIPGHVAA